MALRIVAFCVYPGGYRTVADWAQRSGHDLALVVTLPGRGHYGGAAESVVDVAAHDVLVCDRLDTTAATLVAALAPDFVVSASFPRRIPDAIIDIPRLGAVNAHPTPLPRGRGPNPQRLTYEGDETIGATLHRLAPEFDAGRILSVRERPLMLAETTPAGLMAAWLQMVALVLEEGIARAAAGEPGEEQDEAAATYAGPFTDEERVLDWTEPAETLQRRVAALNILEPLAVARVDGRTRPILDLRAAGEPADAAPGTVLHRAGDVLLVATGDGAVEATLEG